MRNPFLPQKSIRRDDSKKDNSNSNSSYFSADTEEMHGVSTFRKRHAFFIKCICLTVAVIFAHQQVGWTQEGGKPVWAYAKPAQGLNYRSPLPDKNIEIPYDVASTQEAAINGGDDVIIHIQDAHSSLSAQYSIAKLLDTLVTDYDLSFIALEGASGDIDTSILRTFPDKKIRKDTAAFLMREGRMSAGEFFTITSEKDITLCGVEDDALYQKNVESFREVASERAGQSANVEKLLKQFSILGEAIYSEDMRTLNKNCALHRDGVLGFSDHWKNISFLAQQNNVDISKYAELSKLLESIDLEKEINFKKANRERRQLIDELSKVMNKADLEELVLKSLAFKQGKLSQGDYHKYLINLAKERDISADAYENLIMFTRYVSIYESIDLIGLYREMNTVEDGIREKLYRNADERELYRMTKMAQLLNQLYCMELTNGEFSYVADNYNELSAVRWATTIRDYCQKYEVPIAGGYDLSGIIEGVDGAVSFYRDAEARNNAMLANTIRDMRKDGKNVAALITGGFHTDGLTGIMQKQGLSYLVVVPKFESGKERPYVAILTNKKKAYEKLLDAGKYQLAVSAYFASEANDVGATKRFLNTFFYALGRVAVQGSDVQEASDEWYRSFSEHFNGLSEDEKSKLVKDGRTPEWFKSVLDSLSVARNGKDAIMRYNSDGEPIYFKLTGTEEKGTYELLPASVKDVARIEARTEAPLAKRVAALEEIVGKIVARDQEMSSAAISERIADQSANEVADRLAQYQMTEVTSENVVKVLNRSGMKIPLNWSQDTQLKKAVNTLTAEVSVLFRDDVAIDKEEELEKAEPETPQAILITQINAAKDLESLREVILKVQSGEVNLDIVDLTALKGGEITGVDNAQKWLLWLAKSGHTGVLLEMEIRPEGEKKEDILEILNDPEVWESFHDFSLKMQDESFSSLSDSLFNPLFYVPYAKDTAVLRGHINTIKEALEVWAEFHPDEAVMETPAEKADEKKPGTVGQIITSIFLAIPLVKGVENLIAFSGGMGVDQAVETVTAGYGFPAPVMIVILSIVLIASFVPLLAKRSYRMGNQPEKVKKVEKILEKMKDSLSYEVPSDGRQDPLDSVSDKLQLVEEAEQLLTELKKETAPELWGKLSARTASLRKAAGSPLVEMDEEPSGISAKRIRKGLLHLIMFGVFSALLFVAPSVKAFDKVREESPSISQLVSARVKSVDKSKKPEVVARKTGETAYSESFKRSQESLQLLQNRHFEQMKRESYFQGKLDVTLPVMFTYNTKGKPVYLLEYNYDSSRKNEDMAMRRVAELNSLFNSEWQKVDKAQLPEYMLQKPENLQKVLFVLSVFSPEDYEYLARNNVRLSLVKGKGYAGANIGDEKYSGLIESDPRGPRIELSEERLDYNDNFDVVLAVATLAHEKTHHEQGDIPASFVGLWWKAHSYVFEIFRSLPSYEQNTFRKSSEIFKKLAKIDINLESLGFLYLQQRWFFALFGLIAWSVSGTIGWVVVRIMRKMNPRFDAWVRGISPRIDRFLENRIEGAKERQKRRETRQTSARFPQKQSLVEQHMIERLTTKELEVFERIEKQVISIEKNVQKYEDEKKPLSDHATSMVMVVKNAIKEVLENIELDGSLRARLVIAEGKCEKLLGDVLLVGDTGSDVTGRPSPVKLEGTGEYQTLLMYQVDADGNLSTNDVDENQDAYRSLLEVALSDAVKERALLNGVTVRVAQGSGQAVFANWDNKSIEIDVRILDVVSEAIAQDPSAEKAYTDALSWIINHDVRHLVLTGNTLSEELAMNMFDVRDFLAMDGISQMALLKLLDSENVNGLDADNFDAVLIEAKTRFEKRKRQDASGRRSMAMAMLPRLLKQQLKYYATETVAVDYTEGVRVGDIKTKDEAFRKIKERTNMMYGFLDRVERTDYLVSIGLIELDPNKPAGESMDDAIRAGPKFMQRIINGTFDIEQRVANLQEIGIPVNIETASLLSSKPETLRLRAEKLGDLQMKYPSVEINATNLRKTPKSIEKMEQKLVAKTAVISTEEIVKESLTVSSIRQTSDIPEIDAVNEEATTESFGKDLAITTVTSKDSSITVPLYYIVRYKDAVFVTKNGSNLVLNADSLQEKITKEGRAYIRISGTTQDGENILIRMNASGDRAETFMEKDDSGKDVPVSHNIITRNGDVVKLNHTDADGIKVQKVLFKGNGSVSAVFPDSEVKIFETTEAKQGTTDELGDLDKMQEKEVVEAPKSSTLDLVKGLPQKPAEDVAALPLEEKVESIEPVAAPETVVEVPAAEVKVTVEAPEVVVETPEVEASEAVVEEPEAKVVDAEIVIEGEAVEDVAPKSAEETEGERRANVAGIRDLNTSQSRFEALLGKSNHLELNMLIQQLESKLDEKDLDKVARAKVEKELEDAQKELDDLKDVSVLENSPENYVTEEERFYLSVIESTRASVKGLRAKLAKLRDKKMRLIDTVDNRKGISKIFNPITKRRLNRTQRSIRRLQNEIETKALDALFDNVEKSIMLHSLEAFKDNPSLKELASVRNLAAGGMPLLQKMAINIVKESTGQDLTEEKKKDIEDKLDEKLNELFSSADLEKIIIKEMNLFFGNDGEQDGLFFRDFIEQGVLNGESVNERLNEADQKKLESFCLEAEDCFVELAFLEMKVEWQKYSRKDREGLSATEQYIVQKQLDLQVVKEEIGKLLGIDMMLEGVDTRQKMMTALKFVVLTSIITVALGAGSGCASFAENNLNPHLQATEDIRGDLAELHTKAPVLQPEVKVYDGTQEWQKTKGLKEAGVSFHLAYGHTLTGTNSILSLAGRRTFEEYIDILKARGIDNMRFFLFGDYREGLEIEGNTVKVSVDPANMDAFLKILEAKKMKAHISWVDFMLADGVATENGNKVGEFQKVLTDPALTAAFWNAQRPLLAKLKGHKNIISIEPMNEAELVRIAGKDNRTNYKMARSFMAEAIKVIREETGKPVSISVRTNTPETFNFLSLLKSGDYAQIHYYGGELPSTKELTEKYNLPDGIIFFIGEMQEGEEEVRTDEAIKKGYSTVYAWEEAQKELTRDRRRVTSTKSVAPYVGSTRGDIKPSLGQIEVRLNEAGHLFRIYKKHGDSKSLKEAIEICWKVQEYYPENEDAKDLLGEINELKKTQGEELAEELKKSTLAKYLDDIKSVSPIGKTTIEEYEKALNSVDQNDRDAAKYEEAVAAREKEVNNAKLYFDNRTDIENGNISEKLSNGDRAILYKLYMRHGESLMTEKKAAEAAAAGKIFEIAKNINDYGWWRIFPNWTVNGSINEAEGAPAKWKIEIAEAAANKKKSDEELKKAAEALKKGDQKTAVKAFRAAFKFDPMNRDIALVLNFMEKKLRGPIAVPSGQIITREEATRISKFLDGLGMVVKLGVSIAGSADPYGVVNVADGFFVWRDRVNEADRKSVIENLIQRGGAQGALLLVVADENGTMFRIKIDMPSVGIPGLSETSPTDTYSLSSLGQLEPATNVTPGFNATVPITLHAKGYNPVLIGISTDLKNSTIKVLSKGVQDFEVSDPKAMKAAEGMTDIKSVEELRNKKLTVMAILNAPEGVVSLSDTTFSRRLYLAHAEAVCADIMKDKASEEYDNAEDLLEKIEEARVYHGIEFTGDIPSEILPSFKGMSAEEKLKKAENLYELGRDPRKASIWRKGWITLRTLAERTPVFGWMAGHGFNLAESVDTIARDVRINRVLQKQPTYQTDISDYKVEYPSDFPKHLEPSYKAMQFFANQNWKGAEGVKTAFEEIYGIGPSKGEIEKMTLLLEQMKKSDPKTDMKAALRVYLFTHREYVNNTRPMGDYRVLLIQEVVDDRYGRAYKQTSIKSKIAKNGNHFVTFNRYVTEYGNTVLITRAFDVEGKSVSVSAVEQGKVNPRTHAKDDANRLWSVMNTDMETGKTTYTNIEYTEKEINGQEFMVMSEKGTRLDRKGNSVPYVKENLMTTSMVMLQSTLNTEGNTVVTNHRYDPSDPNRNFTFSEIVRNDFYPSSEGNTIISMGNRSLFKVAARPGKAIKALGEGGRGVRSKEFEKILREQYGRDEQGFVITVVKDDPGYFYRGVVRPDLSTFQFEKHRGGVNFSMGTGKAKFRSQGVVEKSGWNTKDDTIYTVPVENGVLAEHYFVGYTDMDSGVLIQLRKCEGSVTIDKKTRHATLETRVKTLEHYGFDAEGSRYVISGGEGNKSSYSTLIDRTIGGRDLSLQDKGYINADFTWDIATGKMSFKKKGDMQSTFTYYDGVDGRPILWGKNGDLRLQKISHKIPYMPSDEDVKQRKYTEKSMKFIMAHDGLESVIYEPNQVMNIVYANGTKEKISGDVKRGNYTVVVSESKIARENATFVYKGGKWTSIKYTKPFVPPVEDEDFTEDGRKFVENHKGMDVKYREVVDGVITMTTMYADGTIEKITGNVDDKGDVDDKVDVDYKGDYVKVVTGSKLARENATFVYKGGDWTLIDYMKPFVPTADDEDFTKDGRKFAQDHDGIGSVHREVVGGKRVTTIRYEDKTTENLIGDVKSGNYKKVVTGSKVASENATFVYEGDTLTIFYADEKIEKIIGDMKKGNYIKIVTGSRVARENAIFVYKKSKWESINYRAPFIPTSLDKDFTDEAREFTEAHGGIDVMHREIERGEMVTTIEYADETIEKIFGDFKSGNYEKTIEKSHRIDENGTFEYRKSRLIKITRLHHKVTLIGYDNLDDPKIQYAQTEGETFASPYNALTNKAGLVLRQVEGVAVNSDGTVTIEDREIAIKYFVSQRVKGEQYLISVPAKTETGVLGTFYGENLSGDGTQVKVKGVWDGDEKILSELQPVEKFVRTTVTQLGRSQITLRVIENYAPRRVDGISQLIEDKTPYEILKHLERTLGKHWDEGHILGWAKIDLKTLGSKDPTEEFRALHRDMSEEQMRQKWDETKATLPYIISTKLMAYHDYIFKSGKVSEMDKRKYYIAITEILNLADWYGITIPLLDKIISTEQNPGQITGFSAAGVQNLAITSNVRQIKPNPKSGSLSIAIDINTNFESSRSATLYLPVKALAASDKIPLNSDGRLDMRGREFVFKAKVSKEFLQEFIGVNRVIRNGFEASMYSSQGESLPHRQEGYWINLSIPGRKDTMSDGYNIFPNETNRENNVENWITVRMRPEVRKGFDPSSVESLGLRISLGRGKAAAFSGVIELKDFRIQDVPQMPKKGSLDSVRNTVYSGLFGTETALPSKGPSLVSYSLHKTPLDTDSDYARIVRAFRNADPQGMLGNPEDQDLVDSIYNKAVKNNVDISSTKEIESCIKYAVSLKGYISELSSVDGIPDRGASEALMYWSFRLRGEGNENMREMCERLVGTEEVRKAVATVVAMNGVSYFDEELVNRVFSIIYEQAFKVTKGEISIEQAGQQIVTLINFRLGAEVMKGPLDRLRMIKKYALIGVGALMAAISAIVLMVAGWLVAMSRLTRQKGPYVGKETLEPESKAVKMSDDSASEKAPELSSEARMAEDLTEIHKGYVDTGFKATDGGEMGKAIDVLKKDEEAPVGRWKHLFKLTKIVFVAVAATQIVEKIVDFGVGSIEFAEYLAWNWGVWGPALVFAGIYAYKVFRLFASRSERELRAADLQYEAMEIVIDALDEAEASLYGLIDGAASEEEKEKLKKLLQNIPVRVPYPDIETWIEDTYTYDDVFDSINIARLEAEFLRKEAARSIAGIRGSFTEKVFDDELREKLLESGAIAEDPNNMGQMFFNPRIVEEMAVNEKLVVGQFNKVKTRAFDKDVFSENLLEILLDGGIVKKDPNDQDKVMFAEDVGENVIFRALNPFPEMLRKIREKKEEEAKKEIEEKEEETKEEKEKKEEEEKLQSENALKTLRSYLSGEMSVDVKISKKERMRYRLVIKDFVRFKVMKVLGPKYRQIAFRQEDYLDEPERGGTTGGVVLGVFGDEEEMPGSSRYYDRLVKGLDGSPVTYKNDGKEYKASEFFGHQVGYDLTIARYCIDVVDLDRAPSLEEGIRHRAMRVHMAGETEQNLDALAARAAMFYRYEKFSVFSALLFVAIFASMLFILPNLPSSVAIPGIGDLAINRTMDWKNLIFTIYVGGGMTFMMMVQFLKPWLLSNGMFWKETRRFVIDREWQKARDIRMERITKEAEKAGITDLSGTADDVRHRIDESKGLPVVEDINVLLEEAMTMHTKGDGLDVLVENARDIATTNGDLQDVVRQIRTQMRELELNSGVEGERTVTDYQFVLINGIAEKDLVKSVFDLHKTPAKFEGQPLWRDKNIYLDQDIKDQIWNEIITGKIKLRTETVRMLSEEGWDVEAIVSDNLHVDNSAMLDLMIGLLGDQKMTDIGNKLTSQFLIARPSPGYGMAFTVAENVYKHGVLKGRYPLGAMRVRVDSNVVTPNAAKIARSLNVHPQMAGRAQYSAEPVPMEGMGGHDVQAQSVAKPSANNFGGFLTVQDYLRYNVPLPDAWEILDEDDEPQRFHYWTVAVGYNRINAVISYLVEEMRAEDGHYDPKRIIPSNLKKNNPQLYKDALRWNIDLFQAQKIEEEYKAYAKKIERLREDTEVAEHITRLEEISSSIEVRRFRELHDTGAFRGDANLQAMISLINAEYGETEPFSLGQFDAEFKDLSESEDVKKTFKSG